MKFFPNICRWRSSASRYSRWNSAAGIVLLPTRATQVGSSPPRRPAEPMPQSTKTKRTKTAMTAQRIHFRL